MRTTDTCFLPNQQIPIMRKSTSLMRTLLIMHYYMYCIRPFLCGGKKSFSWQHVDVLSAAVYQIRWFGDVKKKKPVRGDQLPWITPQIQREISRRNRLFKKHAKNPTKTSWEEFKKQINKVTSLKRKGLKAFCMEASTNTKHHGEFWNNLRSLLPNKGNKSSNQRFLWLITSV